MITCSYSHLKMSTRHNLKVEVMLVKSEELGEERSIVDLMCINPSDH